MQSTSETTARQRLRRQPNLTPRSSALLPVRITTARRPDHIHVRMRYDNTVPGVIDTVFVSHMGEDQDPLLLPTFSSDAFPCLPLGTGLFQNQRDNSGAEFADFFLLLLLCCILLLDKHSQIESRHVALTLICTGAEPIHPVQCPRHGQLGHGFPKRGHFSAILAGFSVGRD